MSGSQENASVKFNKLLRWEVDGKQENVPQTLMLSGNQEIDKLFLRVSVCVAYFSKVLLRGTMNYPRLTTGCDKSFLKLPRQKHLSISTDVACWKKNIILKIASRHILRHMRML